MKRFTLLKSTLMLAVMLVAGTALAQEVIFKETFGTADVAGKPKIAAYTGYDNTTVVFEGVSATDGDIRSTSTLSNSVWLPANKVSGIIMKGINTVGCTDMVLSFDATANKKEMPFLVTVKANGTAIAYPATIIAAQNVYQTITCTTKLPEGASLDLEISTTATDNTDGYRLDNIVIMGKKGTVTVPSIIAPASVAFSTVGVGSTKTEPVAISAVALTGDLTVSVDGEGFTSSAATITKADAEAGMSLDVTFAPTVAKEYSANLTISGGGLTEAKVISLTGSAIALVGAGTEENPYTVADVITLNNMDKGPYFVKGYIVGAPVFKMKSEFAAPFTTNTALYMGDNVAERDTAKLIPVQLPSGDIRTALNLMDKPENLGKELIIKANLEAYFGAPGLKTPTEFKLNETSIVSTAVANRIHSVNGKLQVNAAQVGMIEIYNVVGQKIKTQLATEGLNEVNGLSTGQIYIVRFAGKAHKIAL